MGRMVRSRGFLALGVVLIGCLAYANSFQGAFVFDDVEQIVDNAGLRDLGKFLTAAEGYTAPNNRYVPYLTFAINLRLGGLDVRGFHLVNLAVHLSAALVLFWITLLAFRTPRLRGSALAAHAPAVAFTAAALFVAHPIQTQAVAYIVQRIASLAAMFYLLAIALYLAWRLEPPGWRRRLLLYPLAMLSALLATRSKEIAFTLPFALLLFEAALFGRPGLGRLLGLAPFGAIALLIPISLVRLSQPIGKVLGEASAATHVQATMGRLDYLRTQVVVVAAYLRLLLLPVGQNIDHDFPVRPGLADPAFVASLALHAALLALAGWAWLRSSPSAARPRDAAWRLVSVGILFFFLAHAVESSVIPIVDVMFEHRVYLPSAGFFLAVAAAGGLAARRVAGDRLDRLLVGLAVALSLVLAVASLSRNRVWRSDLALWTDAASKSPGKARPWFDLGTALADLGRNEEALEPLRRAAKLDPTWAKARTQLGGLLILTGRYGEAESELEQALRLKPEDPPTTFNLAEALWRGGRREEAARVYGRYLALTSSDGDTQLRRIAERRSRAGERPAPP